MHSPPVSQQTEYESWSGLTTISSFDAGTTRPIAENEDDDMVLQGVKRFSPTSLLVESLIDQLCKLLEHDASKQKKLYNVICHKLHQMKLIDQTYGVEEFEFMRSHYQKSLFQLFGVAKSTVINNSDALIPISSPNLGLSSVFHHECLLDWSRYRTDYEELEYIDKGGFGQVYRIRNKLDGGEYAVKKICLRYHNVACFLNDLREVKMLARLNHPNIVSYKAAWLEPYDPNSESRDAKLKKKAEIGDLSSHFTTSRKLGLILDHDSDEEDSSGVIFQDSPSGDGNTYSTNRMKMSSSISTNTNIKFHSILKEEASIQTSRCSYQQNITSERKGKISKSKLRDAGCDANSQATPSEVGYENSKAGISSKNSCEDSSQSSPSETFESEVAKAVCKYRRKTKEPYKLWSFQDPIAVLQHDLATLYIQMQLCERTLRQWLDERNAQRVVNMKESFIIFQKIVTGVNYIHMQDIVHHDIKPSNIFVNEDLSQVQVGDFGLACCLQHSTQNVTLIAQSSCPKEHKGQIGTKLYAAPEQLRGMCDPKSDIFSLGIVLFELLQPFSTTMERSKLISLLKSGHIPADLTAQGSKLEELLRKLTSHSTANRPTAQELLTMLDSLMNELFNEDDVQSKDETIKQLLMLIEERDKEIKELKLQVKMLEGSN